MKNARREGRAPAANNGEMDSHRKTTPDASPATHRRKRIAPLTIEIPVSLARELGLLPSIRRARR